MAIPQKTIKLLIRLSRKQLSDLLSNKKSLMKPVLKYIEEEWIRIEKFNK